MAPKGQHTRPTQDYVRESLFNIIQREIPDAAVLDLFAGSGALALEAISRGAANAALVDSSRQAITCIRHNVEALRLTERTTIIQSDWKTAVQRLSQSDTRFDLIFLDPPYRLSAYREITDCLAQANLLSHNALIITEHRKDVQVELSSFFLLKDQRAYGDTVIHMHTFDQGGNTGGK